MSRKMLNQEFYDRCKAFVMAALGYLKSRIENGGKIPASLIMNKDKGRQGSRELTLASQLPHTVRVLHPVLGGPITEFFIDPRKTAKSDPSVQFMWEHQDFLSNLPEFSACVGFMRRDARISRHISQSIRISGTEIQYEARDYLFRILAGQLKGKGEGIEFLPEEFDRSYNDLEQFIYSDYLSYKVFTPLHNFESTFDKIILGNELLIRRLSNEELEELLYTTPMVYDAPYPKYAAQLLCQSKKVFGNDQVEEPVPSEREQLAQLVTAMRLFKTGIVGFNILKVMYEEDEFVDVSVPSDELGYRRLRGPVYTLAPDEAKDFAKFWSGFKSIDFAKTGFLALAIRRLNYAYERDRLDDKLIDYLIAFEALFMKKGEMGEFRNRLSIRVSKFLKENLEERGVVMKKMNRFYDSRSKVVHGQKEAGINDDSVYEVEDLLRKSIKRFLREIRDRSRDEIISNLDLG